MAAATRFHFTNTAYTANTPAFDAGWEQTTGADRCKLILKNTDPNLITDVQTDKSVTIPITTTQNILNRQYISDPIQAGQITPDTSATYGVTNNARGKITNALNTAVYWAAIWKVVSNDGTTSRGTFFSLLADTNFLINTTYANNRYINKTITAVITAQAGDRIVIEQGCYASAPAASDTLTMAFGSYQGINGGSNNEYSGITVSVLIPFAEIVGVDVPFYKQSQDNRNYQSVTAGSGMSVGDKVR